MRYLKKADEDRVWVWTPELAHDTELVEVNIDGSELVEGEVDESEEPQPVEVAAEDEAVQDAQPAAEESAPVVEMGNPALEEVTNIIEPVPPAEQEPIIEPAPEENLVSEED